VSLRSVSFAPRDPVQPADDEADDQKKRRQASREYQASETRRPLLRAHPIALLLAAIEELHGAGERVAVASRPGRRRPVLTPPAEAKLQLRVVPQAGGPLFVPGRLPREPGIQRRGGALLLGPGDQPGPTAHQAL